MQDNLLTRAECQALRGLAIIGIFLHNYCHWLGFAVKENEYQFFQMNVDRMNRALLSPDVYLPVHLISFLGHYGVPVFLFLSAYGLTLKYERTSYTHQQEPSPLNFVRYHFLKLFKMMIIGFVAFTMVDRLTPGPHHYKLMDVIAQLGLFNNLLPHPDRIIWPGPYWFFGLMFQLYIVYRLFMYRRHWSFTVALIAVCAAIQLCCDPEGEALNRWRYNFVGGLLPFGLGLLYARYGRTLSNSAHLSVLIVATPGIFIFSEVYWLWYLVPVLICAASIALVKLLPRRINHYLAWMGSISAALFVCHAITRKIFIPISHQGDVYAGLLLYIVASICLAWLFREIARRVPSPKL